VPLPSAMRERERERESSKESLKSVVGEGDEKGENCVWKAQKTSI